MASFLDKFASKVNDLGNKVVEKTTSSTENIRLNNSIKDEERQIANDYEEIGKKYRSMFGSNPAPEFAQLLADIEKREVLVAEYRKKIQQNRGKINCPNCGAEMEYTAAFCASCGAKNAAAEEAAKAKAEAEAKAAAEAKAKAEAKAAAEAKAKAEAQAETAAPETAALETEAAAPAGEKTCSACGTTIAADNLFCTNCGARQDA